MAGDHLEDRMQMAGRPEVLLCEYVCGDLRSRRILKSQIQTFQLRPRGLGLLPNGVLSERTLRLGNASLALVNPKLLVNPCNFQLESELLVSPWTCL